MIIKFLILEFTRYKRRFVLWVRWKLGRVSPFEYMFRDWHEPEEDVWDEL